MSELREKPAGTVRITADDTRRSHPLARLTKLLPRYPDIRMKIIIDYGLTDIVTERMTPACGSATRWRRT